MAEDKQPVRLFKQSFNEVMNTSPAAVIEQDVLSNLKLEQMISAAAANGDESLDPSLAMKKVNEILIEQARAIGATHVFGVEYQITGIGAGAYRSNSVSILASGDAYKPRKK